MSTLSNPINTTAVANLSIPVVPLSLKFADAWRVHPLLDGVGYASSIQGGQNTGANRIADFGTVVSTTNENTAVTDTALPTITRVDTTELQRSLSVGITSQAGDIVNDRAEFMRILDDLIMRALLDDVAFGANGAAQLAASMTAITTSSGTDLSGYAVMDGVDGVASQGDGLTKTYVDRKGFRGLFDWFISNGQSVVGGSYAEITSELYRRGGFNPDGSEFDGDTGLTFYGTKVYLSNKSAQYYTNGGDTYGIVLPDLQAQPDVQPPIHIIGRANPIGMRLDGDPEVVRTIGPGGEIGIGRYRDTGLQINGHQVVYALRFDCILANTNARAIRYAT